MYKINFYIFFAHLFLNVNKFLLKKKLIILIFLLNIGNLKTDYKLE